MVTNTNAGHPEMGAPVMGTHGPVRTPSSKEINAAYLAFVKRVGDIGVPQQQVLNGMLDAICASDRVREGLE